MGTEGDSFFVVFRSAHQAVRAAVTAQRGLDAYEWPDGHDLRVRMGVHTGEPGWRSLEQRTGTGDWWAACIDRLNLMAALLLGEGPSTAYRWFVEWTPEVLSLRDAQLAVNLVEVGAGIAAAAGSPERAAQLAGCADARRAALTMRRTPEDHQQPGRFLEPDEAALGDAAFAAARREGGALSVAEALDLVTSLRVVAPVNRALTAES